MQCLWAVAAGEEAEAYVAETPDLAKLTHSLGFHLKWHEAKLALEGVVLE
jgi:hypothetical protein